MLLSSLTIIISLATFAHAHFQLQYPAARGPFVEDDEPNFCGFFFLLFVPTTSVLTLSPPTDGFTDAVSNRTTFPLGVAYFTFNSEHPAWSSQSFTIIGNRQP